MIGRLRLSILISLHGAGVRVDSRYSHFWCRWNCRVASRAMSSTEWITPCVLPGAWTLRHMPKYVVDPFLSRSLPWVSLWRWKKKNIDECKRRALMEEKRPWPWGDARLFHTCIPKTSKTWEKTKNWSCIFFFVVWDKANADWRRKQPIEGAGGSITPRQIASAANGSAEILRPLSFNSRWG